MSSNTETLGLLKMDPVTDANDTFNIETMLNNNWDKLDAHAKETNNALADASAALKAEETARKNAISNEKTAREQAVEKESITRKQMDAALDVQILEKLAEAKQHAIIKACQALGADGGLDGTDLVTSSVSGVVGRSSFGGTSTAATISFNLGSLPASARLGFISEITIPFSVESANLAPSNNNVNLKITLLINGAEISALTQYYAASISVAQGAYYVYGGGYALEIKNIAAVYGRPLTKEDTMSIVVAVQSWGSAMAAVLAPSNITINNVRYLEA